MKEDSLDRQYRSEGIRVVKIGLLKKNMIGIILLAISVCISCIIVGYQISKKYIFTYYNNTAYEVADIIYKMFDERDLYYYLDMVKEYKRGNIGLDSLDKIVVSEDYQEVLQQMNIIRESMELNDIYMAYLDKEELLTYEEGKEWNPMVYVFDSYYIPEMVYSIGQMGGLNPVYRNEAIEISNTGKRSNNYFISEGEFGYNTSAIYPITKNGETLGVIGVEVPMVKLEEIIAHYIRNTLLSLVLVTGLAMAIYLCYLYKFMILPINTIKQEVEHFMHDGNRATDRLNKIKTGDEIEALGHEVYKMEIKISDYIQRLKKALEEKEEIGKELNIVSGIAYKDPLTGVKSKAAYLEAVEIINDHIKRGKPDFAVAIFDLNDLKYMNDTYGHEAGDNYLKNACRLICKIFKSSPVYRIGGDEFLAILNKSDYEKRDDLLDEFYRQMKIKKNTATTKTEYISVAVGITGFRTGEDQSFQDVFKRADGLMYENKKEMKEHRE